MYISFSPVLADDEKRLSLEKTGDRLRINGELFNFNSLPDGATIPAGVIPCDYIIGPVERVDGEIHITLLLPHSMQPSKAQAFPEPLDDVPDGVVDIPADTVFEETVRATADGLEFTTVARRWHQEPVTTEMFIPIEKKEVGHVDA